MYDAIQFAAGTGLRIIQIAGYDEYYNPSNENTKQLFLENLRKSVEMAASCGVILAFETMETEFLNTVGKAMYYINLIGSPYLQIYPDLGKHHQCCLPVMVMPFWMTFSRAGDTWRPCT